MSEDQAQVRRIMIMCPTTGRPVPTGMASEESSFKTLTLRANSFGCPLCEQMHEWDKEQSFLERGRPG